MNNRLMVLRVMKKYGWKETFATEYVLERTIHNRSHDKAFGYALHSNFVPNKDKPKGLR